MAWTFRKSLRLPFGIRLNFSKSGVGASWGIPGFRVGKDAKGREYRSFNIPGTGLINRTYKRKNQ